jgi:hydrogenase nickel incorporation protein HypA/HybF
MHELSIALSILDLAEEEGRGRVGRVAAIHVRLGQLCGVVKEALLWSFEMAREGTALSAVELRIEDVPLVIHCGKCAVDQTPASPYVLRCPSCGALSDEIISGRELEVSALEIDS